MICVNGGGGNRRNGMVEYSTAIICTCMYVSTSFNVAYMLIIDCYSEGYTIWSFNSIQHVLHIRRH